MALRWGGQTADDTTEPQPHTAKDMCRYAMRVLGWTLVVAVATVVLFTPLPPLKDRFPLAAVNGLAGHLGLRPAQARKEGERQGEGRNQRQDQAEDEGPPHDERSPGDSSALDLPLLDPPHDEGSPRDSSALDLPLLDPPHDEGSPASEHPAGQKNPEEQPPVTTHESDAMRHTLEGDSLAPLIGSGALTALEQAVGTFEGQGWDLAFILRDLETDHGLSYNADEVFYPASSMKAARVCALYQELVEEGELPAKAIEDRARQVVVYSDNDAYSSLRESYGGGAFARWLEELEVGYGDYGSYGSMAAWNYPHVSTRQLARMWEGIYAYLLTESEPAQMLAALLEQREVSPLRDAVGDGLRTWGKAGWFESRDEYRSEPATAEGGIVFAPSGTYLVVVMSNAPAQLDALIPVFAALDQAHADIV